MMRIGESTVMKYLRIRKIEWGLEVGHMKSKSWGVYVVFNIEILCVVAFVG